MKRRRRKQSASPVSEIPGAFVRGFIVTALLVTLQDRSASRGAPPSGRKILRHAIQGGAALAAGTVAAEAMLQRDFPLALAATAAGTAGMVAAEYLLNDNKENGLGQEEA